MREDYSVDGNAWDYFSHDQARSRAYRWGEDGLAGLSDDKQRLCFAVALWNGRDPIRYENEQGCTAKPKKITLVIRTHALGMPHRKLTRAGAESSGGPWVLLTSSSMYNTIQSPPKVLPSGWIRPAS